MNNKNIFIIFALIIPFFLGVFVGGYYFNKKCGKEYVVDNVTSLEEDVLKKDLVNEWAKLSNEWCEDVNFETHGTDKADCRSVSFIRENPDLIDPEYCEVVDLTPHEKSNSTKDFNHTKCVNEIAVNARDTSICTFNSVADLGLYETCVYRITIYDEDPSSCNIYYPNLFLENDCYRVMAYEKGDIDICKLSTDSYYKDKCYSNYFFGAERLHLNEANESICNMFDGDYDKSFCYMEIAKRDRNSDLCQNVKSEYSRESGSDGLPINLKEYCNLVSDSNFGVQ